MPPLSDRGWWAATALGALVVLVLVVLLFVQPTVEAGTLIAVAVGVASALGNVAGRFGAPPSPPSSNGAPSS